MLEVFVFILGLIVGSFANVCIYRLPRDESIVRPPSHCPSCNKSIAWYDNIPILSFVFLKGKCRFCKNPISCRYPLVEFLTAFLFLTGFKSMGSSILLPIYWYFFVMLVIATFTDFSHLIIPDIISIPGMFTGIILSFIFPEMMKAASHIDGFLKSFAGAMAGGGTIWIIGIAGKAVFRKEAMGFGDVKLMGMAGSFIGVKLTLLSIFLGSLFGAVVGGILILARLKTRKDYIPFGPYLSLGALTAFFFGEKILDWYFGLLTLV